MCDDHLPEDVEDAVWEEGAEAGRNAWGMPNTSACPYESGSQMARIWGNGYMHGYASVNH